MGLTPIGKRLVLSAHGEEQVDRFVFRIGIMPMAQTGDPPGFPFVFDEVSGFALKNSFTADALIGMDILAHCDFMMARDGSCRLSFG